MYIQNPWGFLYIQRADWLFFWLCFDISCFLFGISFFCFWVPVMFFNFPIRLCWWKIKTADRKYNAIFKLRDQRPMKDFSFLIVWYSHSWMKFFITVSTFQCLLKKIASQPFGCTEIRTASVCTPKEYSWGSPNPLVYRYQCLELKIATAISKIICAMMLTATS